MAARGARAQGERMRRIGVLMNLTADDPEAPARVTALAQGLQQLGWTVGRNVRMDYRLRAGIGRARAGRDPGRWRLGCWTAASGSPQCPDRVLARSSNGGLIVTAIPPSAARRKLIVALAARHRLPAVYSFRYYATSGGLISYGPDTTDPFRRAAGYIDRILKSEKPANLPVLQPTKFELFINLTTTKALGLTMPPTLLARADEVIE